jgi:hypothetical protein
LLGMTQDKECAKAYLNEIADASETMLAEYHGEVTRGYVAAIQYYISQLYQHGLFFRQNEAEYSRWYNISKKQGYHLSTDDKDVKMVFDFKILSEEQASNMEASCVDQKQPCLTLKHYPLGRGKGVVRAKVDHHLSFDNNTFFHIIRESEDQGWYECEIAFGNNVGLRGKVPAKYIKITHCGTERKYLSLSEKEIPANSICEVEELGAGGFGKVYKAKWEEGENAGVKYVAVKRLLNQSQEKIIKTHLKEMETLLKLSEGHQNIVGMFGYTPGNNINEAPGIVLEFMNRGDLSTYLGKRQDKSLWLPWPVRISIALDMAKGLLFLHEHGIWHRDIKSENVLLCEHGGNPYFAKLADFGLAHQDDLEDTYIGTSIVGTLPYQSPELLLERRYSWYTDIYALAVVLWELLTHERPEILDIHLKKKAFIEEKRNIAKEEHLQFCALIERGWLDDRHARIKAMSIKEELERLKKEEKYQN